jgi:hypothetical protein
MTEPPLLILGVRRSGTTLLRVMLDRSAQLAVPDESYFVPQLAHRHGRRPDIDDFVDDLRRLPTLREWGLTAEDVRARLRPGMSTGEAIGAIYEAYAAARDKARWGDKTPMYMEHLLLLRRLFPSARFVHLIRDGRDAALSFLSMPEGVVTRTWAHPTTVADFACQWRAEVRAARALGREVGSERYLELRYETLVSDPERELRGVCEFAGVPFERAMLDYAGAVDVPRKPHQQSLRRPPTPGLRDWRGEMRPEDIDRFEAVAGDLLGELGYERRGAEDRGGRVRRARYRLLMTAWKGSAYALQRSPLWAARHPPVM